MLSLSCITITIITVTTVPQVITLPSCVLSVSMSAIQMHTVGGLFTGKFCTAPTGMTEEGEEAFHSFTCAAALRPPGALVTADSVGDTHILVGTSSNFAYMYDINVLDGDPLLVYDVCCPTVCVRASEAHLAVAGTDGKVRLLDSRLRNMNVTHTFDAHTGPVRDLCLQPDGVTMLTCGMVSRPVNPFDPKSPVNVSSPLFLLFLLLVSSYYCFFVTDCDLIDGMVIAPFNLIQLRCVCCALYSIVLLSPLSESHYSLFPPSS